MFQVHSTVLISASFLFGSILCITCPDLSDAHVVTSGVPDLGGRDIRPMRAGPAGCVYGLYPRVSTPYLRTDEYVAVLIQVPGAEDDSWVQEANAVEKVIPFPYLPS